jgi:outer membrane murein-binding lipoprotein Lpp
MDARELRQRAMHYRRVAGSVSDEAMAEALLELAAKYDSLADRTEATEPTPGAAQQSAQQCPLDE